MDTTKSHLAAADVQALDPYAFMAVIGKRVIHPGGQRSTEELFDLAKFQPGQHVLDIGCGVGTTAIALARRFGLHVTAADISPVMRERAAANVRSAGLADRVRVEEADITALPYPDGTFDRVVAEAVTMFVDRARATCELVRVCRTGGRVLATEFLWRRPPTAEARQVFFGEVCPGMTFDTLDDWVRIYREAGLAEVETTSGPFEMMTPVGFLGDEGPSTAWLSRAMRCRVRCTCGRWRGSCRASTARCPISVISPSLETSWHERARAIGPRA